MFCMNCGKKIGGGTKFCPFCGAPVQQADAPAAGAPATGTPTQATGLPTQTAGTPAQVSGPAQVPGAPSQAAGTPPPYPPTQPAPQPAVPPAPRRRRPKRAVIITLVVIIAVIAAASTTYFLVKKTIADKERTASNSAVGYGGGGVSSQPEVAKPQYDYFYSTEAGGIVKGDPSTGTIQVIRTVDSQSDSVTALGLDGNTLFFAISPYMDPNAQPAVHSINIDGTNEQTLFTSIPSPAGNGSWSTISQINVYDGNLYILAEITGSIGSGANSGTTYGVITMGEDGSNAKLACTVTAPRSEGGVVVSDKMIVWSESDSKAGTGVVKTMNLDGTNEQVVYASPVGTISDIAATGNRLYLQETNGPAGRYVVTGIDADGNNAATIYESPASTGCRLLAAADGNLFLESYHMAPDVMEILQWDLVKLPADGGTPTTIAANLDIYNPVASDLDGRLLLLENGQYAGSAGVRAVSVDYDGTKVVDYPLS